MRAVCALAVVCTGACTGDIDPPWQLDHDRVIAVRSSPARIAAGETAEIDALIGRAGAPPLELDPDTATVESPAALEGALARQPAGWTVTAPQDEQLAVARAELGLAGDEPVPLRLRMTFAEPALVALKVIWLGQRADNPVIEPITIDGKDGIAAAQLAVAPGVDVPLAVDFDDRFIVNWLTSCGTMHDFDLPAAYLRVEPEDPQSGTLGVVVRDELGGVAWRTWPITAE